MADWPEGLPRPMPDLNALMAETEEWAMGRRSWANLASISEDPNFRLAMVGIMDAMEVVKRAALMVALRARYG